MSKIVHFSNYLKNQWLYVTGNPVVLAVVLVGFGLVSLLVGMWLDIRILENVGMATFSAGVFSAFFKAMQAAGVFAGVFSEEVQKASDVFSDQVAKIMFFDTHGNYLKKRSDLKDIWLRVTKALHGDNFPRIEDKIAEAVRQTLPDNFDYYFEDVNIGHTVELIDPDQQVIRVITVMEATLIPNQTSETIEQRSGYTTKAIVGIDHQHEWKELEIGDEKDLLEKMEKDEKIVEKSGEYSFISSVKIKNQKKPVQFKGKYEVTQCLKDDRMIGYVAMSYVDGLKMEVFWPTTKLDIVFHPFGVTEPFERVGISSPGHVRNKFNGGLLFAKQGYLVEIVNR